MAGVLSHALRNRMLVTSPATISRGMGLLHQRAMSSEADRLRAWIKPHNDKGAIADKGSSFETVSLRIDEYGVVSLRINRPKKLNSMNMQFWDELASAFKLIDEDSSARCVVLGSEGRAFSAGMDLAVFASMTEVFGKETCEGRKREQLNTVIKYFQDAISAPEKCKVPVIAAISGPCIGGAVDLVTACDIRLCDSSAEFSVKEVDLAIVADIGTLQRLPKLVGDQNAKELSYTGRNFSGEEATRMGLTLRCYSDKNELDTKAYEMAKTIASKSPLTVRGVKKVLNYTRDHSVQEGLDQVRLWNSAHLYSADLDAAFRAVMTKTKPTFRD